MSFGQDTTGGDRVQAHTGGRLQAPGHHHPGLVCPRWAALAGILYIIITCFAGEAELSGVTTLLKRFFFPVLETLSKFASGEVELGKEVLQRHLRLVRKIFVAISELSGPEVTETCSSALSSVMGWMDKLHIRQTCQHLTRFQSYF